MSETENEKYVGKHILVGLTYVDDAGEITEQRQLHGEITRVTEVYLFFERADGEGEFKIPMNPDALEPGEGEYTLHSTGEVVKDPDFVSVWKLSSSRPQ